jgi:tetratricopeptide (TPR) repeat protein
LTAEAKKKAAKVDPAAQAAAEAEAKAKAAQAELKKGLTPLATDLTNLMMRIQGRGLLSPEEAGKLVAIKYKLLDLMEQYPQNPLLAKPLYQAGMLFSEREAYNDAFEMFQYLAQGYISNPYGAKAKGQIQMLERKFGANYFSVEMAAPVTPAVTAATPAGVTASATPNASASPTGTPAAPSTAAPAPKK